ncbi:hypothetical protein NIES2119_25710 [[Phormidium ambiguum] IAM M-71]|uniref:Uncharacterized protein n=1 Tax=[Phormidium ambiguum] IAM M-71 TaxID=454136 RepID=A0A1U7I802_9CYAN|nr:hypothetical protein [Phormidium ambiguum]OKH32540.1 hypothetical protein NIES2119_25710 [Phormidium ambiguum IAM M-71]
MRPFDPGKTNNQPVTAQILYWIGLWLLAFDGNTARLRGKGGICSRLENENKTPKKIRLFHPLSLSKEKI